MTWSTTEDEDEGAAIMGLVSYVSQDLLDEVSTLLLSGFLLIGSLQALGS